VVYVEGRLKTRKWQDKEGKDNYTQPRLRHGIGRRHPVLSGDRLLQDQVRRPGRAASVQFAMYLRTELPQKSLPKIGFHIEVGHWAPHAPRVAMACQGGIHLSSARGDNKGRHWQGRHWLSCCLLSVLCQEPRTVKISVSKRSALVMPEPRPTPPKPLPTQPQLDHLEHFKGEKPAWKLACLVVWQLPAIIMAVGVAVWWVCR